MSQAEIESMLYRIEISDAPETKMGAMCYGPPIRPERVDYTCPTCGEKTLYTTGQVVFVQRELQACRRELETIKGSTELSLSLDESSFCKNCQPDAKKQELKLTVTYEDGKVHTVSPVCRDDLRILKGFLEGKLSYKTFNDGTWPLKEDISRLRELLGVAPTKNTKQK